MYISCNNNKIQIRSWAFSVKKDAVRYFSLSLSHIFTRCTCTHNMHTCSRNTRTMCTNAHAHTITDAGERGCRHYNNVLTSSWALFSSKVLRNSVEENKHRITAAHWNSYTLYTIFLSTCKHIFSLPVGWTPNTLASRLYEVWLCYSNSCNRVTAI